MKDGYGVYFAANGDVLADGMWQDDKFLDTQ
jgi:hypothetical protein